MKELNRVKKLSTSSPNIMQSRTLNLEQKQHLCRDGFLVVKNAVPPSVVDAALSCIKAAQKGDNLMGAMQMTDLVNASSLTPILQDVMGEFDAPTQCQIGVLKRRGPGSHYNNLGYRDADMPYYGAELHMDGNITIAAPQQVQEGEPDDIYQRYIRQGPKGDIGRTAEVMGHNFTPLFQDPQMTLSLGSFTAFLFVCLNDQTKPGCGQTSLLPGAHHATEKFFRQQYATNGHIGPEGPGWDRLNHASPNHSGMNYLPNTVLDQFCDEQSATTPDGRRWPEPTQILMEPGDACIATYHIPHSGSRNENGSESRKNIIFRIRNKKRQPDKVLTGLSDHPDRGWLGEWLDYEPGNNPWERSKHAMCNMWDEWQGLADIVDKD